MATLLIVAHAPLATALKAVACHAFPEQAGTMLVLDVHPTDSLELVETRLRALMPTGASEDVLILADVFGATPCNAAMRVADGARRRVVSGVNVPMIWRALCYGQEPLDALVARAVGGATQGVMQLAATRPQNQGVQPGHNSNGQDQHHHQQ